MTSIYINAVGMATDGIANWVQAVPILRGDAPFEPEPMPKYAPQLLPANERRRVTQLIRLAFNVCEQVTLHPDRQEGSERKTATASVFASAGGDYQIINQICNVVSSEQRLVSPTQFHNSVHNSAAGYWSIATGSMLPSVSLSSGEHTFVAGLLEACLLATSESIPVLLAVYDTVPPEPLLKKRPIKHAFAAAFLLTPTPQDSTLARVSLRHLAKDEQQASKIADPMLETLRCENPAARSLPLLDVLAKQENAALFYTSASGGMIALDVEISDDESTN